LSLFDKPPPQLASSIDYLPKFCASLNDSSFKWNLSTLIPKYNSPERLETVSNFCNVEKSERDQKIKMIYNLFILFMPGDCFQAFQIFNGKHIEFNEISKKCDQFQIYNELKK
jgi:hypothetical protein